MVQEKEINVVNADFAAALAENPPSPWGRGHLALYGCCIIVYLCSTMNGKVRQRFDETWLIMWTGYDGSLMGSINSIPNYLNYYNVSENEQAGTGIVFAIFQVGQMTGAFFVWMADWKGRKVPIFLGCFGVIIGTIVTATAKTSECPFHRSGAFTHQVSVPTFIGGRFLLSFFCTWAATAAPMYCVEVAPPLYRGTVSGLYVRVHRFCSVYTGTAF